MKGKVAALLLIGALILFPRVKPEGYHLRLASTIFMWIALSEGWNISSGYTGYIDFGPVAYFGAGAYTVAILMTKGKLAFLPSLLAGGVVPFIISIFVGVITLRIRGAYFAIATLAFSEALKEIVLEFDGLFHTNIFGGSFGITMPIGPTQTFFYYVFLALAILSVICAYTLERSKMGYGLRAIKGSEDTAEMCGVNTLAVKVKAYSISAFIMGLAGGANAYWLTYITPGDVFSIHTTIQMVVGTLLGGMGTVFGPVVGAIFLAITSELLWARFTYEYLVLLGIIVLIVNTSMPEGIVGRIKGWKRYSL